MKAKVTDDCIACELCVGVCPEVFEMGEGIAVVKTDPVPESAEETCKQAAEQCPVTAILIEE